MSVCHGCVVPPSATGTERDGDFWLKSISQKIVKTKNPFFFEGFKTILGFLVSVLANHSTVYGGGVSRRRVCDCGCYRW